MRTDLGTWRGPQAQTVVRALRRAGLTPQTEGSVAGIRITVPEAQNDAAHQVLAGAMDDIARAARDGSQRQGAAFGSDPAGSDRTSREDEQRPLVSERLVGFAPFVGLVAALVLAAMIPPGAIRTTVFVFALVGFGVVWARRHDGDADDDYGRGPR